jgi:SMI1-KNR4 cell-wall
MKFEFSKQKLSINELNNIEIELKIKLPEKYKKLILEYNGGAPERNNFKGKWVNFNSIKYGKNPIEKTTSTLEDVLPNKFFPFGSDPGGWLFCFDLNEGEDYGKIYFFQGDGEYYLLANSFEEFMNELTDDPDE